MPCIAVSSYYRWLKEEKWSQELPQEPVKLVQVYEATEEEKEAVRVYELKHPAIRAEKVVQKR